MINKQVVLGLMLLAVIGCRRNDAPTEQAKSAPSPAPAEHVDRAPASVVSYADVVERVAPSVVTIHSARRLRAPRQFPFLNDPRLGDLFGRFFGESTAADRTPVRLGLGSGVIIRADGYILTNFHVVDGADEISIELPNRRGMPAKVVGTDAPSDLAVIKVDAGDLTAVQLGNSDDVRVGDIVLALGNPLGIGQTVTSGIISAKGRATGLSDGSFEDFLQTDAPINQGNSGGALVNSAGQLVGINSQILSPNGGNIGIGFAVPVNMARNVMEQLIKNGKVERGQLGVAIEPVTPQAATNAGMKESRGVLVREINPNGAANRAGLQRGDIIVAFNDQQVSDGNTLRNAIAATRPGTAVKLTVLRNGKEQTINATLDAYRAPEKTETRG